MNTCFGETKLEDYCMDFDADIKSHMNFDNSFDTENGKDVDLVIKNGHVQNSEEPRFEVGEDI